ncbi:MAG: glutathione S-transferase [Rhodobacterales bacterium]|nr:MAG: glutathione S-transferase [Rhodobacterales bacterium]
MSDKDEVVLHGIAGSRSFRVLWLLYEMGISPRVVTYSITDGSLRAPEFLAMSPAGRVPALEIDGRVLFESGAITEYLCETRPEHGLAPAVGSEERPQFLTWIHYAETIGVLIQNLNMQHLFLRDPAMRSVTVMGIETKRLAITLRLLEQVLAQHDYLLASGFSAADTMMGFTLDAASHYVRLDEFAHVRAYKERIEARPAYQRAAEAEGLQRFYDRDFYELPEA